jgi:predicted transposase YdaD
MSHPIPHCLITSLPGIIKLYSLKARHFLTMRFSYWNMENALRVRGEEEREIGERIGEKRGRELGEKQAAYSYAARMKSAGLDIKLIVECTGLKPKEVEKL